MKLTRFFFSAIFGGGVEIGALSALIAAGLEKPYYNKAEACREYGRQNIEEWLDKALITVIKDGNDSAAWRLNRLELATLAKSIEIIKLSQQASNSTRGWD